MEMMTENSLKRLNSGCVRNLVLLLLLISGSATAGWWIGKAWIDRSRPTPAYRPAFTAGDPAAPSTESQQEWQDRAKIRARRSELGIDSQFFRLLVDETLTIQYPDLGDDAAEKRRKRSLVSLELLDRLAVLDGAILRELGTYGAEQRREWRKAVNELHLGSQTLYDLADGGFFAFFPEVTDRPSFDRPLGQVWSAFAVSRLQSLQSGSSYRKIETLTESGQEIIEGSLTKGAGNAYSIDLRSGRNLTVNLSTDGDVTISLYSPTGSVKLLENSSDRQWSGQLSEDGFYELIILSKSATPITFRLDLQVAKP
ncbi:hypothetical protein [Pannus brasiliensis]